MSERFNQSDVALARNLRAVESANDVVLRASAELMMSMLDACEARNLKPVQGHAAILQIFGVMNDAMAVRTRSLTAHQSVAELGQSIGLPVTAWGNFCLASNQQSVTSNLTLVEQAA